MPVLKRYPARLSVLSLTCIFGLLQFLAIAAFTEEDLSRWKVRSGGELFTILYAVRNHPTSKQATRLHDCMRNVTPVRCVVRAQTELKELSLVCIDT